MYQLTHSPSIILDTTHNTWIPIDPANRDYQKYLVWLKSGNTPNPMPPLNSVQLYNNLLANGINITSHTNSSLDGIYPVDAQWKNRILAITDGLANGRGFPHKNNTLDWPDITRKTHAFTASSFLDFAAAVETFITDAINSEMMNSIGISSPWPSRNVSIP